MLGSAPESYRAKMFKKDGDVGARNNKRYFRCEMGSTVDHGSSFDDGLFDQCEFLFSGGEGGETEVKYFLEVANASVDDFS